MDMKTPLKKSWYDCMGHYVIMDATGKTFGAFKAEHVTELDAMIAFVNACAGINPEAVPKMITALSYIAMEDGTFRDSEEKTQLAKDLLEFAREVRG